MATPQGKSLKKDAGQKPNPQYWNPTGGSGDGDYEELQGSDGALHIKVVDNAGTEYNGIPIISRKGTKTFSEPLCDTTPRQLLAANANRLTGIIVNTHASARMWLGGDNTVNVNQGIPLEPGDMYVDGDSTDAWWGVLDSGSDTPTVMEVA